jgi:hypothetical protein
MHELRFLVLEKDNVRFVIPQFNRNLHLEDVFHRSDYRIVGNYKSKITDKEKLGMEKLCGLIPSLNEDEETHRAFLTVITTAYYLGKGWI